MKYTILNSIYNDYLENILSRQKNILNYLEVGYIYNLYNS